MAVDDNDRMLRDDRPAEKRPAPLHTKRVPLMVLGGICLLGAGVAAVWVPERDAVQGALLRLGILVTALGYALPREGERFHLGGAIAFLVAGGLAMPAAKRLIPVGAAVLVPLLILMTLFRPRQKPPPLR